MSCAVMFEIKSVGYQWSGEEDGGSGESFRTSGSSSRELLLENRAKWLNGNEGKPRQRACIWMPMPGQTRKMMKLGPRTQTKRSQYVQAQ